MNKRQWLILGLGSAASVLPLMLAMTLHPMPTAGPIVEESPSHYSLSITDASLPLWAALSAVGVVVMTGALVYKSRNVNG